MDNGDDGDPLFADTIGEAPKCDLPEPMSCRGVLFDSEARWAPNDLRNATFELVQELASETVAMVFVPLRGCGQFPPGTRKE